MTDPFGLKDTSEKEELAARMIRDTFESGRLAMLVELFSECCESGRVSAASWLLGKMRSLADSSDTGKEFVGLLDELKQRVDALRPS